MKLSELLEAVSLEKTPGSDDRENAKSPCEFLTACGINYVKTFRDDETGADFKLDNVEVALDAYNKLTQHTNIQNNFLIKLEKDSNIIKVYFK